MSKYKKKYLFFEAGEIFVAIFPGGWSGRWSPNWGFDSYK
jgi:hypothetical protein